MGPGPQHHWCPHSGVALETKGAERTAEATPLETSPAYNKELINITTTPTANCVWTLPMEIQIITTFLESNSVVSQN